MIRQLTVYQDWISWRPLGQKLSSYEARDRCRLKYLQRQQTRRQGDTENKTWTKDWHNRLSFIPILVITSDIIRITSWKFAKPTHYTWGKEDTFSGGLIVTATALSHTRCTNVRKQKHKNYRNWSKTKATYILRLLIFFFQHECQNLCKNYHLLMWHNNHIS